MQCCSHSSVCVLVFFDDILIYSCSWTEHLQHLRAVFKFLCANSLHVKRAKCAFTTRSMAYLGHIISAADVTIDSDKVAAVTAWPQPRTRAPCAGFSAWSGIIIASSATSAH